MAEQKEQKEQNMSHSGVVNSTFRYLFGNGNGKNGNHPYRGGFIGAIAGIAAIIGIAFAVDGRYVTHADFVQLKTDFEQLNTENGRIRESMIIDVRMRKSLLEMQEIEGNLTPRDEVELRAISKQLQVLEREE